MRVSSHTLPIWPMWRAWKLLVHLLVIAVLPSWWWMWWRVEGLIVLHLLIRVVLMSVVGKIVLIRYWQSSLQGLNSINDSSNGVFHPLKSCVDGLLVLLNSLVIASIMARTSLLLTHSSSSSPAGGGGGGDGGCCPCFGGMVNRK
jgi:hypothetical protein